MAVFMGYEFMYDNVLSSKFELTIAYSDSTSDSENTMTTNVEFITQKLPRRSRVYHLGTVANEPLSFQVSFFRDTPIYADERDAISHWLTGSGKFKKLQIIQDDMSCVYYNCYFNELKYISFSAKAYGFTATVVCDAPFAWKSPQFIEKVNQPITENVYPDITNMNIYNICSDSNLTPAKIVIELGENNNEVRITNLSNNAEFFQFKDLINGETISIDSDYGIIQSLTRPNSVIIDNFSGEFLMFINGLNKIQVEGQVKKIRIDYQSGRKIG